jgi:diadenosine tetraphosphate (Ap4A) HIT family hydrolase
MAETPLSLAFLDSFPVSEGHALVIPKRHVETIWEMSAEEYTDAFNLVRQVKDLLEKKFQLQGVNIGVNCGRGLKVGSET